jgi:hypothetical protein
MIEYLSGNFSIGVRDIDLAPWRFVASTVGTSVTHQKPKLNLRKQ